MNLSSIKNYFLVSNNSEDLLTCLVVSRCSYTLRLGSVLDRQQAALSLQPNPKYRN